MRKLYEQTPTPFVIRDAGQVAELIEDSFDLQPPGMVSADRWHPDPQDADELTQPAVLAGVGRRR